MHGNPNARKFEEDQRNLQGEVPEAALMESPMKGRGPAKQPAPAQQPSKQKQQAKTILYSDKSETSVEDLMDDTPSNYNI